MAAATNMSDRDGMDIDYIVRQKEDREIGLYERRLSSPVSVGSDVLERGMKQQAAAAGSRDTVNGVERFESESSRTSVRIETPSASHRPNPLSLDSPSGSLGSALGSARLRRNNCSPYFVPPSASYKKLSAVEATMDAVTTPRPIGVLPNAAPVDFSPPRQSPISMTPTRTSHVSSNPVDSMTRRGTRPSFPSPRAIPRSQGGSLTRGLPTPHSASGRHTPHHLSSCPNTAPLSPQRYHQSAPQLSASLQSQSLQQQQGMKKANPHKANLDHIPKEFILKKLVEMASMYWFNPDSADCYIIVPTRRPPNRPKPLYSTPQTALPDAVDQREISVEQGKAPQTANALTQRGTLQEQQQATSVYLMPPSGAGKNGEGRPNVVTSSTSEGHWSKTGRRGSLPGTEQFEQCLVFPLHRDYLVPQSSLFHALLSNVTAQLTTPTQRDQQGRLVFNSPVYRGARVSPARTKGKTAIYVPLPDPNSFGVILHWLYWHDTNYFNQCLSKGSVAWQGVVKNIEYLGLDNEIKSLAGRWWKRWVKPTAGDERFLGSKAGLSGNDYFMDDEVETENERDSGFEASDELDGNDDPEVDKDCFTEQVSSKLSML
ncbi:uncharacterized protein L203_101276 [Cryptococcus depauperatus CBS 7841]|uniref:Uncharacterized protein n=1 Tax=Cryptococcus depauperatus CBS 7841 TaxID=1295531 RepID=A0A1E3ICC0_9TREE|nr:hypothetical protein L203_04368 [Cryptococcus depauperatus CBS 7841]